MTVVRIQGTTTTTTSSLDTGDKPTSIERRSTTALDVAADPTHLYELKAPVDSGWKDRHVSLGLTADGRLATAGAEVTNRSHERLKAVLTIGASAAGGLLAIGAAPIVVGVGAVLAAGATVAATGIEELDKDEAELLEGGEAVAPPDSQTAPSATDLGIRPAFKADRPVDFQLLYGYRIALLKLAIQHVSLVEAVGTATTKAADLEAFTKVLALTRAEAEQVETRYEAWLRSKQEAKVGIVDVHLIASEIPSEDRLTAELHERSATHTEPWWDAVDQLRTVVTIDYLDGLQAPSAEPSIPPNKASPGAVVYRAPRPAMLKTWKILDARGGSPSYRKELVRQDRVLVTVPGTEREVVVVSDKKSSNVGLGIDLSGALTSFNVTASGSLADRASVLAALPSQVQGAVVAGAEVGNAFNPQVLEAERLKREVAIAEANASLKGPADPNPKLKKLQESLAVAEAEARLASAEMVSANPSMATIVVQSFG